MLKLFSRSAQRILSVSGNTGGDFTVPSEADEDHVALQKKGQEESSSKKYRISMPKLVYVHEGIDGEKSTKKRTVLKNVRYFGGDVNTEELWLQVAQYIDKQYKEDLIETIYISGDGASWIRQGLHWINKSKFVLDNYHLNKYVTASKSTLSQSTIFLTIWLKSFILIIT